MINPKVIAFYLPQYHPTPHNDEWWGKGFTEWTNVGKAKRLFPGHYQPKVPADLGYYDLRLPQVREQQVELAKEAGVDGFCYYHYWFEDGKEELDLPFKEVLKDGKPEFPFCLCWANESWYKKMWNIDGTIDKCILAEQKYQGDIENERHFYALLDAFRDSRYIRIDDKPVFMIYRFEIFEGIEKLISQWNSLALKNGLNGIYFIAYSLDADNYYDQAMSSGFNAVCSCRLGESVARSFWGKVKSYILMKLKIPRIYSYKKVFPYFISKLESSQDNVFPTIIPNWDHTPRSGRGGYLLSNSTPELFELHAKMVLDAIKNKPEKMQVCFLKSWNEWGEGNYMEPDLKYQKGYINALKRAKDSI